MKTAIEMVSLVLAITLGCMVISSIISCSNQAATARDFYNTVVNRVEDSNSNSIVISQCIEEANKNGYQLKVDDVTIYQEHPSKFITMKYTIKTSFFRAFGYEYEKQAVIEGYAR